MIILRNFLYDLFKISLTPTLPPENDMLFHISKNNYLLTGINPQPTRKKYLQKIVIFWSRWPAMKIRSL